MRLGERNSEVLENVFILTPTHFQNASSVFRLEDVVEK
jgi:hypothetical protein